MFCPAYYDIMDFIRRGPEVTMATFYYKHHLTLRCYDISDPEGLFMELDHDI